MTIDHIHVMLDLETWGVNPGCAIRSIGAVAFRDEIFKQFYLNITEESCLSCGLTKDPGTVHWWAHQSEEAKAALEKDQVPLLSALSAFSDFIKFFGSHVRVWAHGATFDPPILNACYTVNGLRGPIDFRYVRDTRTLYDVFDFDPKTRERAGTHHNALDDAIFQAECVMEVLRGRR